MKKVVTIAERKARSARARREAIDAAIAELRRYASSRGGRYLVFGSTAKGKVHGRSDLDVLVDFAAEDENQAFRHVEEVCSRHGIPCDPQYRHAQETAFIKRVREHAIILS